MKLSHSCTRNLWIGACAALAIFTAANVTASCKVWWLQSCCEKAGVGAIVCGTPPNTWRCHPNLVSDPAVGSLEDADCGWDQIWAIDTATCTYNIVACASFPNGCIYAIPAVNVQCNDVFPPTSLPNCDTCP